MLLQSSSLATGAARASALARAGHWLWVPALLLFAGTLFPVLRHHEPWFDELHAWVLARDSGLGELLGQRLRYEGSPGLWHLLLWGASHLGLPPESMKWMSGTAAVAGAYLWMRHAPVPLPLRLLAPFGYYTFFQYGVVARSYCLMPPLAFLAARLWRRGVHAAWPLAGVLILLSHVSVPGLLMAGGLWAAFLWQHLPGWSALTPALRRRLVLASGVLLAAAGLVVWQLLPPADLNSPANEVMLDPRTAHDRAYLRFHGAFAEAALATLAVQAVSLGWFGRRRVLSLYLLPMLLLLLFFGIKYANLWHEGALVLVWLLALWVSYEAAPSQEEPWLRRLMTAAGTALLLLHASWSVAAARSDLQLPYSGTGAAAAYLREHCIHEKRLFGVGFPAWGVQAYFPSNVFANHNGGRPPAYWLWSTRSDSPQWFAYLDEQRSDYLLVSLKFGLPQLPAGYVKEATFPGKAFWKDRVIEDDSFELYRRADLPESTGCTGRREQGDAR